MDQLHSISLLLGLVLGVVGFIAGVLQLLFQSGSATLRRISLYCAPLGAIGLSVSIAVHRIYGHGTSSQSPMNLLEFAGQHPAFPACFVLLCVAFWLARK